jgi:GTPase SAR1 family protein
MLSAEHSKNNPTDQNPVPDAASSLPSQASSSSPTSKQPINIIFIGMAGSGKTTLLQV